MRVRRIVQFGLAVAGVLGISIGQVFGSVAPAEPSAVALPRVTAAMVGMPLQFEANYGQVDEQVKFLARGQGYTLFLTPTESVMVLQQREAKTTHDPFATDNHATVAEPAPIKRAVVRMKLEGVNPSPKIDGTEQLPGIVNYFIGDDPEKWRTKIPTYAKVQYKEAYPGIDLAYYGNQGKLEYDFIVAPGADPNQIKLAFEGASAIRIADSGDLLLTTALGEVRLQKPVVYQLEADGHKTLVAGNYVVSPQASQPVHIQLAAYDHNKPVVIDPVLAYSSYLGGNNMEEGYGIAVDSAGSAYVAGRTFSTNFPTVNPFQGTNAGFGTDDMFVTKVNAAGTGLLYSTYLGGNNHEIAHGIAVDGAGQAYVTGTTSSLNFPTANPFQAATGGLPDAFVVKLNAAGSGLLYSTYLGGGLGDEGLGIAVDSVGSAYVTGQTVSSNFPIANPILGFARGDSDAFITKLTPAGTGLLYSTYLGGTGTDRGHSIAVDSAGSAYVTGSTGSTNFPVIINPGQAGRGYGGGGADAFVTKLSDRGNLILYSTYLGGGAGESGNGIAVDSAGQVYVTGWTSSGNFPTANPVQAGYGSGPTDVFVTKLSAGFTGLLYSTYLGGFGADLAFGIAVDSAGQAYVTGLTSSANFPLANPVQAAYGGGSQDVFVTKLSAAGTSLLYSTYLGGSGGDSGFGIAVNGAGQAFVTGQTVSTNFPTANPFQTATYDGNNAFIAKLAEKPTANAGPDQTKNEGTLVTLDGSGSNGLSLTYAWTQVAGPPVALTGANTASPTFTAPMVPAAGATLTFQLVVTSGGIDSDPDTVNVHVTNVNQAPVADAGPNQTVQEGSPVLLDGSASYDPDSEPLTYLWMQSAGPAVMLVGATTATPMFTAPSVGSAGVGLAFELTVTDPHGLNHSATVFATVTNVNQTPVADAGSNQTVNENTLVTLNGSASHDPDLDPLAYFWSQVSGPSVALTGANSAAPTFTAPSVMTGGDTLRFQLVVNDGHASSAADTVDIYVQDTNDPPVCTLAQPSVATLWPPNHTMVPVSILGVTDPSNQQVTITYTAVTQDEPVKGLGDGDTSPDAAVSGNQVLLRAERSGTGNGRVYAVHFTASDGQGGSCSGTVQVSVPHSKQGTAGNSGQLYDSFAP